MLSLFYGVGILSVFYCMGYPGPLLWILKTVHVFLCLCKVYQPLKLKFYEAYPVSGSVHAAVDDCLGTRRHCEKNGEEIRAKVEEVGEQSIRYRKFTNLTGPVYSIARGEVFVIRYESGAKDIITPLDRSAAAGKTQDTGIAAPSQQAMRQAVARAERRKRDKLWTFGLRAGAGVSFWSFKDDLKAQFGSSSEQVSFTSNPRLGFAASAFAERYFNRTGHGHLGVGVGYMQNGGSTEGTVQDESFTYDMRYDAFAVDVYYGMRPVKNGFYMRYGLRLQLPVGMKLRMGASPNLAGLIEGTDTDVALDTWYDVDKELRKSIVPAVNLTYGYTFGHADIGLQWAMAFASPHQEMGKSPWSLSLDFAYRF